MMFPFWDVAIAPVLRAARARRVVEIGALRGETTDLLLDVLGPEAELHVIDPVPQFDPTEHERRFPGRYVFHRATSHEVLPELPPADVALIDGDHNWYTVHRELELLAEAARAAGQPLPVLVMHDVCWPYGRRDLYYAPDRIPSEFRQPHERRGMRPGRDDLVGSGGLNPTLENATREGGARNGVMTALDDFLADYGRAVRRVVLPIYFGLAIVVGEDRLAAHPELGSVLDHLESAQGRLELLELGEALRLQALVFQHTVFYGSQDRFERGARRYLDLLKAALLNEHHLENEVRIGHLLTCIEKGIEPSALRLRDPARYMSDELQHARRARVSGRLPTGGTIPGPPTVPFATTAIGRHRLDHLGRCLDTIREEGVDGDLVDCGVGRGGSAVFLRGYLDAYELAPATVWVADRFGGGEALPGAGAVALGPDLNMVREAFASFGLLDDRVRFLQGAAADSLRDAPIAKVALLRLDDLAASDLRSILDALYDRVAVGGFIVVDDYGDHACQRAIDDFRRDAGIADPLERVDWSGACWRKSHRRATPPTAPVPATPKTTKQLSVVTVVYNMRREAARTLHSLSRSYQEGIDDLDYEVIVVENGSAEDQRLGADFVASFGPEFRYLDRAGDATASPVPALNQGIAASCGDTVAIMIDGAHVLTPGVLRLGMLGSSTYGPAVVTAQQWYVGPGQQNEALAAGYDQDFEDRLFAEIEWPTDGYRLFHVGHFIGDRDWFDGQWESNCLFVPRALLAQVGAFDEGFSMPGGGFANLDLFERVASSPDVALVSILGEGTFHQVHGGTTTNIAQPDHRDRLIRSYEDHYRQVRGRPFHSPAKPFQFVGSLPIAARRTKPRRMGAPVFFTRAHLDGTDGRPAKPAPVPEELRLEFIDAFWRSQGWHQTTWLGKWMHKAPTDLFAYQELVFRVRPDWIIETATGGGGRALFLATVCDLVGSGRVVSIDDQPAQTLPEHPRLAFVRADPADASTADHVRELLGEHQRGLLILGAAGRQRLLRTFEHYVEHVPVGSYVVVEDTIVNGHPVWAGFGPGPAEAVKEIVNRGQFTVDRSLERYALTFNPGGYLKRTS